MIFQELTLAQIPLLKDFFSRANSRLCDPTLGGSVMWRNTFHTRYAVQEDILFFRSEIAPGKWAYTAPLGDLSRGVEILLQHCGAAGEELVFCSAGETEKEEILRILPGYRAVETRDWFDYLYLAEKMESLAGRKLSGQRNHRNFFLKTHPDWRFEAIGDDNIEDVKRFFETFCRETKKESVYFRDEETAVREVLEYRKEYGFFGGLLRSEGEVRAFSFGEVMGDTLFIHVEKADRKVRGSYQMILSQMASHYGKKPVVYINREEDVGDAGLRYSKEEYHPHCLLKKYILEK